MRKYLAALIFSALSAFAVLVASDLMMLSISEKPPIVKEVVKESIKEIHLYDNGLSRETALRLIRATVRVRSRLRDGSGGTGFILWSDRRSDEDKRYYSFVMTCSHVIQKKPSVIVEKFNYLEDKVVNSSEEYISKVVLDDEGNDIALIQIVTDKPFNNTVELLTQKEYETMALYDPCFAVGCGAMQRPFITSGNVSDFNWTHYPTFTDDHIEFTAPVTFGNSGGGLFTKDGKVLGLVRLMIGSQGGPYNHGGVAVPAWRLLVWSILNNYGFIVKAQDGSSLEHTLKIQENNEKAAIKEAQEKAESLRKEKAASKKAEDILKNIKPKLVPESEKKKGDGF